jgi:hypothetical protein
LERLTARMMEWGTAGVWAVVKALQMATLTVEAREEQKECL